MDRPVLLITYNRLDVTEREAESIIGDDYRAVNAVTTLAGGKGMDEGVIYHFNKMGSSALRPRSGGDEYWASLARSISSHPDVSSVCYCNHTVDPARWEKAHLRNARALHPPRHVDRWNLEVINTNGRVAHDFTGRGIKIAILDTGIAKHRDLNVKGGVSYCKGVDDCQSDRHGHGTHCAGIAAGRQGGVAKEADLYSIKVADMTGSNPVAILAGMGWALENTMNVVSISLAGPADPALIPAFANALQAVMGINCVVVASTGDTGGSVGFPANTPGVIAVGGCKRDCAILDGTCIGGNGNHLTVVAPGEDIRTTYGEDGYMQAFSGSSAAAPHVAGLVALIQQKFPGITPLQVIGRILATGQPVRVEPEQGDVFGGATLIDCNEALSLPQYNVPSNPPIPHAMAKTTIEVTVKSTTPTTATHCAVLINNCDARHSDMKRQRINGPTPARFTGVPPGRYYVFVIPEGWKDHREQFIVIDGVANMTSVEFDLATIPTTGRIIATVLVGGQGAPNVTVTTKGRTKEYNRSFPTDGEGRAVFNGLPDDTYDVIADRGSASEGVVCNVTGEETVEVDIIFS